MESFERRYHTYGIWIVFCLIFPRVSTHYSILLARRAWCPRENCNFLCALSRSCTTLSILCKSHGYAGYCTECVCPRHAYCQYFDDTSPPSSKHSRMNLTQSQHTGIISIVSYILLSIGIILALRYDLEKITYSWFAVLIGLLLIRDILALLPSYKGVDHTHFLAAKCWQDYRTSKISLFTGIVILNRVVIFPFLLICYCLFLLIEQINLWGIGEYLHLEDPYKYLPLSLVIASWIALTLRESADTIYFEKRKNPFRTRLFLFFAVILGLMSIGIIWRQTASLGLMSFPISIIAWLLIVLIASLLLEEK